MKGSGLRPEACTCKSKERGRSAESLTSFPSHSFRSLLDFIALLVFIRLNNLLYILNSIVFPLF